MYTTIKDFLGDWKYEKEATLKVLQSLTDESLNVKINDRVRAIGRLAWHITLTVGEMMNRTGLKVDSPAEDAPIPPTAKEIADTYESVSNSLSDEIEKNWNDDSLKQEDNMYGEMWTRAATLLSLVKHQIHHRGQLTVLMRQAGLQVPGIYGPSYEEWKKYGMGAPE